MNNPLDEWLKPFDRLVDQLVIKLDLPIDQVTILIILVLSIPMGVCYRYIQSIPMRNLYAFLPGLIFQYLMYRHTMWVIIFNTVVVYAIVLIFKRRCGNIVAVASIIILSGVHIHRIWVMILLYYYSVFLHVILIIIFFLEIR